MTVKMKFVFLLVAGFLFLSPALASHTNVVGITTAQTPLFNATAIGATTTVTSTVDGSIGRSEHQAVQYRVTGGGGFDVTIAVLTSLDEVNYATPDSGATVKAHVTDSNWHSAILAIPVAKAVEFTGTTNNATTASITLIFGAQ